MSPLQHGLRAARHTLVCVAAMVPLLAAADSQLGAARDSVRAAARVDFKIVIPPALYLASSGINRVTIVSNSRNVTLSAGAHGSVVLSAPAGKVIAQDSRCRADSTPANPPVVCTASMP